MLKRFAFARSKSVNFFFYQFKFLHECKFKNVFLFSGIEYLCENHQLQMNAKDIAHFLYKGEGLNKTAIGECRQIFIHIEVRFLLYTKLENS